jgi:chromosome segregation ATPase
VGIGLLELVEEVKEVLELPKKSIIITPKTTKAELLAELKNKEIRIKTAIEIYGEQEKLKKDLTSKLTSIQLELDTSKKQYAELKGQLEEKEKEFLTLQAKPLI